MKKLSQAEFIEKALSRAKRPVDLSRFIYTNTSTKSTAVCPDHGEFQINPNALMNRIGCPHCALIERSDKRRMTQEEFISRASEVHGGRFDYSLVEYKGAHTKVKIVCPTHGVFEQVSHSHLIGKGCSKCRNADTGDRWRMSQEDFISQAVAIHGDRYDLSRVIYKGRAHKISVICKEHGLFEPTAGNFGYLGSGCPECGRAAVGMKSRKPLSHYVVAGAKKHNGKYGYAGITYKNQVAYLKVVCPEHGAFEQLAQDHMKGIGCRDCAKCGFSTDIPATLYVYTMTGMIGDFVGFGITNNMDTRHRQHMLTFKNDGIAGVLLKRIEFESGREALDLETKLKQTLDCVDTGLEGFRTEAVLLKDIDVLLAYL